MLLDCDHTVLTVELPVDALPFASPVTLRKALQPRRLTKLGLAELPEGVLLARIHTVVQKGVAHMAKEMAEAEVMLLKALAEKSGHCVILFETLLFEPFAWWHTLP